MKRVWFDSWFIILLGVVILYVLCMLIVNESADECVLTVETPLVDVYYVVKSESGTLAFESLHEAEDCARNQPGVSRVYRRERGWIMPLWGRIK